MRRCVVWVVVVLVLGVVTSVAVAWGRAVLWPVVWDVPRMSGVFERWGRGWHVVRVRRANVTFHAWTEAVRGSRGGATVGEAVEELRREAEARQRAGRTLYPFEISHAAPSWGTFAQREAPDAPWTMGLDTAFGWPRRCMWHQVLSSYDEPTGTITANRMVGGLH